jgi:hypothetical protein
MAPAMASCAPQSIRPRPVPRWSDTVGSNLSLEAGTSCCERFGGYVFVDVYSLSMLAKVVEPREASRAVALKRSFARVLTVLC